jgi:predicted DNA repair protein MutK
MAGANLLALIDDIATILDDVAILSKVAAKKTAGVLGDDLALNANQVAGVKAERELPVVWAVAKGSFINKLILVPAALLISAFIPPLVLLLLVLGGAYLCFEGVEKVVHKIFHAQEDKNKHSQKLAALANPDVDMVALEKKKVKGAIRTDFILSAEIIVITLGAVAGATMFTQIAVVSIIAILMTVGVYGIVAGIVKLDDFGLYLLDKGVKEQRDLYKWAGRSLLRFSPFLMKTLSVLGTLAMFLVGGGIILHSIPHAHELTEQAVSLFSGIMGQAISHTIIPILINAIAGILVGIVTLGGVSGLKAVLKACNVI